ncbi:AraC family transcriptional regulator [Leisingera sp. M527]|uniref:AraC family transcriptional regulator n=1 Tax=Leisingera sp. M527 TaxID=2867014 RepID=UPI0021A39F45|nr:AraC family transcriptional regulator [Leisingera sp. M527]UWQ34192.1 AraC family transcriptional regulator [Leisingera sp. M527]
MTDLKQPEPPHPSCYVIHETGVSTQPAPVAVHAEHGLVFAREGWFTMEQRYETLSLAGSVTIVPAGVPHRPLAGEDLDYWLLGFSAGGFGLDEEQAVMRPFAEVRLGASPVIHLENAAQARLQLWFETLAREAEGQNELTADVQRSLITLILSEVSRAMPSADEDTQRSPLVAAALRYIQRHSLSPISLSDVASAVSRTAPHVAAVVKADTGFTVGTWITSARLAKAAQLLQHTDIPVDQIAPHIGWQDTTHFIRQFRRIYGVTPAAWRKKQRLPA